MKRSPRPTRKRRAPASRTAPTVLAVALALGLCCAACGQRGPLYLPDAGAPANEVPAADAQPPGEEGETGDSEKDDASPA